MKVSLRKSDDVQAAYALHLLTFPGDEWEGERYKNHYWIAKDETGTPVGFCSARRSLFDRNCVTLSRAGILPSAQGLGLQRRMIRVRLQWAKSIDAHAVYTYVSVDNHQSLVNLLRSGFRLYHDSYAGKGFLYLWYPIRNQ